MAFTYTPGASNRDNVRLLIADTDTVTAANQIFTDAEIDAFLSLESNDVYGSAASACSSIAASTGRSAIAWKSMKSSMDMKDVPKHFKDLAKMYREKSVAGSPWEEVDSLEYGVGPFGGDRSEYVGDQFWS